MIKKPGYGTTWHRHRHLRTRSSVLPIVLACLAAGLPWRMPIAVAENAGFVKTVGARFMLDGAPHFFAGANFWQGMNLGMDGAAGGDRERLGRELDRMQALGLVNLRVMALSEGPDSEPYRMRPSLQPAPGLFNEAVFAGLDYLLHEMNRRNMRAVMTLNNYWHWSGGMAQYVAWADGSPIPYPPSHPDFTGDWGTFMTYSARFYSMPQCQTAFRTAIAAVVGRTNTISGRLYRNDPTIFAWELANEPRNYPQAWIDETAAYIKSLDPNHMVTSGSEGSVGGDFLPTHDGPHIDYATCHIWPQNWGWYQPDMPGTYAAGLQNALDYLQTHADLAATALGKPLVLEEFGLARDGGSLDPAAATTFRDDFFAQHYAAVEENAEAGGALAGDNLWAWAGEGRPGVPSPQWIGDPPHETPGWYSVYDADAATLLVLAAHADQLACLSDDRDRDGLPDSWEWWRFGSLTRTSGEAREDGDGDGASDRNEYLAGTDANDAKDYLAIRGLQRVAAPPAMHLSWNTVTGRLYTVTIAASPCEPFGAAPDFIDRAATGTSMTYTNGEAGLPGTRFYRIQVRPPW